jgi:RND family efflux transporter MFP subunit
MMMRDRAKLLTPAAVALVMLLLLVWLADGFRHKVEPGLQDLPTPPPAELVAAELVDIALFEPVAASIEARQATIISSRLLARISSIHVRAGDSVSVEQPLIDLEQDDLEARVLQAREKIRASRARRKEASLNLERVHSLYERRLVAEAELDRARASYDTLSAELSGSLRALEEAETALTFTEIRSPIEGRVVDRFAEPGDTATPGSKLLSLYNPLSLRIESSVREQLALPLREGQTLQVEVPSLQRIVQAEIEERVPAAEPGSRSFLIKAVIPYDQDYLPGMYARLQVPAGKATRLLIPADRIVRLGQLKLVWVLVDGQAHRRFIKTGVLIPPNRIEVLSGLEEGDLIMTTPDQ